MRKIIVNHNCLIPYQDDDMIIESKTIHFTKNGDYVIEYIDSDDISLELWIEDNVTVKLFIISKNQSLNVSNHYILGGHSNLLLFQFYENKQVQEKVVIDLNGEYSKYHQGFSSVSRGFEEYNMIVNHNQNQVSSSISNKCIGLDGSSIHIQIDSILEKGNINCAMDQNSRILTLGDVDAKIVPNMFIEEDCVEARHGSIIGSFQEEEIFYLMSRGISREEAELLLIKGFLFSNLLVDMEKREVVMESILNLRR